MDQTTLGIDIGGTKIASLLINAQGSVIAENRKTTDIAGGYPAILLQVIESIRELTYDLPSLPIALGVGVAGQVCPKTGTILSAGNLNWQNAPLKEDLEAVFQLKTLITNDVRAATWAEWRYGAGRGAKNLLAVFVGTGVGGGLICNGDLLTGSSNTAGEIGHLIIEMEGPRCSCGNQGCLEAFAGGWAIANRAQEKVADQPEKGEKLLQLVNHQIDSIQAKEVITAFNAKDPLAVEIMIEAAQALVIGLTGAINLFNPEKIILGGGIIEAAPDLVPIIIDGITRKSLLVATRSVRVTYSELKGSAVAIGAAALANKSNP